MGEVLPKIQARMLLDKRMLYASELFLPDGTKISSYDVLVDTARRDTAVIVGCGEPFDPQCIPPSMLSVHLQGGGRDAACGASATVAADDVGSAALAAAESGAAGV